MEKEHAGEDGRGEEKAEGKMGNRIQEIKGGKREGGRTSLMRVRGWEESEE